MSATGYLSNCFETFTESEFLTKEGAAKSGTLRNSSSRICIHAILGVNQMKISEVSSIGMNTLRQKIRGISMRYVPQIWNFLNSHDHAEALPLAQPTLVERIRNATSQDYKAILQEIAKEESPVVAEMHTVMLAKALGVAKGTLAKELKAIGMDEGRICGSQTEPALKALAPGLVDIVKDDDGKIQYLLKDESGLRLVETIVDADGVEWQPPPQHLINFPLVKAEPVMRHYAIDDIYLYRDLANFAKRFSYLEDDVWPIIILSIYLSYLQDHEDVRYIPIIYFYAVAERGKSRTAKTMLATSYRGQHLVDIRSANIIRFSQHLNSTIFFDMTEFWKSAEKGDGQDILLGRFEKGTKVVRVQNPDKGPLADQVHYDVFGSTIVATNEPANQIFESRCLSITMPNRPGQYEDLKPEMGMEYRERLTSWRAKWMHRRLPSVEPIPGISGRLWDISKPLFQLAKLVAPEAYAPMKNVILEMAGHKVEDKKETLEGQIVAAIDSLAIGGFDGAVAKEISVKAILEKLNFGKPEHFHTKSPKLGKRLQALSLATKQVNGLARLLITARELQVLKEQYGLAMPVVSVETLPLPTTPPEAAELVTVSGRELVESAIIPHDSPTDKEIEYQSVKDVVASGRELQGALTEDERYQQYLELVEDDVKSTEPKMAELSPKPIIDWGAPTGSSKPDEKPIIQWA